jgi:beta-1,4-mannosyltransferase
MRNDLPVRRVVHLPCYHVNPYQRLLMTHLEAQGFSVLDGGGGGNFLRSALFRWKAKNIHLHWLHPYIIRKTWLASALRGTRLVLELFLLRLSGKRLVWTVHNLQNHQGAYRGIERNACRWISRIVHGVICHSDFAAAQAIKAYGIDRSKITVYPHPIWQRYTNTITLDQAREKLGIRNADCVFLFLGRVSEYKGIEDLINAFRKLSSQNVRLVIAGGPTSDAYRERIIELSETDDRIQLHLRFIEDDEMQGFLNAASVVVFPFREILTSGSILLAMEFSKPCIAPAIGAIPETLPAEQGMLTYNPAEQDALLATLKQAVTTDPEILREIGAANRRKAEHSTWEGLAEHCIKLYV